MQIVQIEEMDRKRIRVFLENGEHFLLYKGEARKCLPKEGEELFQEQYDEIRREILVPRAKKRALHLLEKMDRTEWQIRKKLEQGEYPPDVVEEAVAYVKGYHYLDDARYASHYVHTRKEQKSQRQIYRELLEKGVERERIRQTIEEECGQETEYGLILKWAEKKRYSRETADLKEKRKLYQFLMRKGFRPEDILHVLELDIK